jgi:hypothetical protein
VNSATAQEGATTTADAVKPAAILVLGMHRSGTSALTRVLNLLGAELGQDLLAPAADNRLGFWEDHKIVDIHDALLSGLGRSWDDLRELPVGWLDSTAAASAREALLDHLRKEFDGKPLWTVKDPRMCRLMPLWRQVLGDLGIRMCAVLAVRHPCEVIGSLVARSGMAEAKARLMWLEHMAEAELATRGVPRVVVTYEQILADWEACARRMGAGLGVDWPVAIEAAKSSIDSFLNTGERHHYARKAAPASIESSNLVDSLYLALEAVAQGAAWRKAQAASDDYASARPIFLNALAQLHDESAGLHAHQQRIEAALAQQHSEIQRRDRLYQVLLNATQEMGASWVWNSTSLLSPDASDRAQLYMRKNGEDYSEAGSVVSVHNGLRESTVVVFELPVGAGTDFVRFDPSDLPGEYDISKIVIDGQPVPMLDAIFSMCNGRLISKRCDEVRIVFPAADPYVEFDLRDLALASGESHLIEIHIQRITLRVAIEKAIERGTANNAKLTLIEPRLGYYGEAILGELQSTEQLKDKIEPPGAQATNADPQRGALQDSGAGFSEAVSSLTSKRRDAQAVDVTQFELLCEMIDRLQAWQMHQLQQLEASLAQTQARQQAFIVELKNALQFREK